MKITLKNIKHSPFASEETHCFEATVYIDGKRSFIASNNGHGGCDDYHPLNGQNNYKEVNDLVNKINAELSKNTYEFHGMTLSENLEGIVCNLVNDWLLEKEVKKNLKKIVLFNGDKISTVNLKPTNENIERVKAQKWYDGEIIVNSLAFNEAVEIFKAA